MRDIVELQEELAALSESTLAGLADSVVERFGGKVMETRCLCECITIAVRARSEQIDLLVEFVKKLLEIDPFRMVYLRDSLREKCLEGLVNNWAMPCQDGHRQSLLKFLYLLVKHDVLETEDVVNVVGKLVTRSAWSGLKPKHLLFWLGPEIRSGSPQIFEWLTSSGDGACGVTRGSMPPIYELLASDNVERLITDGVNLEREMPERISEFDNIWVGKCVFEFGLGAARFGSVKCFKYWMMNHGVDVDLEELANNAIVGGNPEIIRLCEQMGCQFQSHAVLAIKYHRYGLFEWLWRNSNEDINEVIFEAVTTGNLPALSVLLAHENKLGVSYHNRSTMLHYAVTYGLEISVRFLIESARVNVNAKDNICVCFCLI